MFSDKIAEIIKLFVRLGFTAFGGPAAHIAMMEDEFVEKRKWLDRQKFLDIMGATNLIPGPNSTEMTMHLGLERAGVKGMLASGLSFILPAAFLTGLLGWVYVTYGHLPDFEPILKGIKPVVLVIILQALIKLFNKAAKNLYLLLIGIFTAILNLLGVNEILALLIGGLIGLCIYVFINREEGETLNFNLPIIPIASLGWIPVATSVVGQISVIKLFWVFLKVGAVLFGSGYVLFAYLEGALIEDLGWLTYDQLIDAIAIGQFTPGPVLTTATFIGYQIAGFKGAVLATVGIFLPSFFYVAALNPLIPKMRDSKLMSAVLDAVNVAALGLLFAVLLILCKHTLVDWQAFALAGIAYYILFYWKKISVPYLVVLAGVVGWLIY